MREIVMKRHITQRLGQKPRALNILGVPLTSIYEKNNNSNGSVIMSFIFIQLFSKTVTSLFDR